MSPLAPSRPGSPSERSGSLLEISGTPRTTRAAGDRYTLTSNRREIGHEMDTEMLVCPIKNFQDSYLPFVPTEGDVSSRLRKLMETGLLIEDSTGALRWKDFPKSPNDEDRRESDVFPALKHIANELAKDRFPLDQMSSRNTEPHLQYRDCPNAPLTSEIKGANFRIDGCFELNTVSRLTSPSSGKLVAPNTVVIAEYKKHLKDDVKNREQVVSAASHIMNDDPRRAFMFGITIEDTMMSLWYFSRSHSTKSEPFDFIKDPKLLVSIFLSFLFGTEEELGYDPAVRRYSGDPIYYEYRISGEREVRYYRTRGALSSYRSLGITGRMTRVWRAVQISDFGGPVVSEKEVALKDVWLDYDTHTEGSIQQEIFKAVDSERKKYDDGQESRLKLLEPWDPAVRDSVLDIIRGGKYRKYFLEISFDGQGFTTKNKPRDAKPTLDLFTPGPKDIDFRSRQTEGSDPSRSKGNPTRSKEAKSAPTVDYEVYENRHYLPKMRYLLIFDDVCTALYDATDLKTSFIVLNHAWVALTAMFIANWVHRDVSAGNILFVGEGEHVQGKLSDLEYARPFLSKLPHSADPKTGTPYFMAYELLTRNRVYVPEAKRATRNAKEIVAGAEDLPGKAVKGKHQKTHKPLTYNFQHDLESLWWIALWILLACVAHRASREYATRVYVNKLHCPAERGTVFLTEGRLVERWGKVLHFGLSPLIDILDDCRAGLRTAYVTREREGKEEDPHTYTNIYQDVRLDLLRCLHGAQKIQNLPRLVGLRSRLPPSAEVSSAQPTGGGIPSTATPNSRKRARSTDVEERESSPSKVARTIGPPESSGPSLHPNPAGS